MKSLVSLFILAATLTSIAPAAAEVNNEIPADATVVLTVPDLYDQEPEELSYSYRAKTGRVWIKAAYPGSCQELKDMQLGKVPCVVLKKYNFFEIPNMRYEKSLGKNGGLLYSGTNGAVECARKNRLGFLRKTDLCGFAYEQKAGYNSIIFWVR